MTTNNKLITGLCLLLVLGLTSCLKDKNFDDGKTQAYHGGDIKPIEIKLTAADPSNFLEIAGLGDANKDTTFNLVPVNLATSEAASEDIHVTLEQNNQLVTDFNAENDTEYEVPTADMFQVSGLTVTIPRGQRTGYMTITMNPSKFAGGSWALGYTIKSVQEGGYTVSGNMQNGIVALAE